MSSANVDPCAGDIGGFYELQLHIGSVFIIMFFSLFGTLIPLIGRKVSALKVLSFQVGNLFCRFQISLLTVEKCLVLVLF